MNQKTKTHTIQIAVPTTQCWDRPETTPWDCSLCRMRRNQRQCTGARMQKRLSRS